MSVELDSDRTGSRIQQEIEAEEARVEQMEDELIALRASITQAKELITKMIAWEIEDYISEELYIILEALEGKNV